MADELGQSPKNWTETQVIFLLTSPVEKPLLHTFYEFFTDMEGHEDIICICESESNFLKWQSFAEGSCGTETVNNFSVVGMKMSHVNATVQNVQPVKACTSKHLPVFVKGICQLETNKEEEMASLEILTLNHCDETTEHFISEEKDNMEQQFLRGGRVTWLNFWLAEHKHVGEVIERDAYKDVSELLKNALKYNAEQTPVKSISIYHHPGSGGSTVARQVLWKNRKDLRCAVVKPSYSAAVVAQHAVDLREYEEKDPQSCLPVLLLIEDSDKEYLDDLRNELEVAINSKQIQYGIPCFIFLSCSRSYDPERRCKESPLQNVSVTHKLSAEEKRMFAGKRKQLARLHYKYEMFEEAEHWADTAARQLPNNSHILDTKGQVYKKWFQAKRKAIDNDSEPNTAKSTADAVKTALKAMQCFQDCERAAAADTESINNSGYFAEAEVGCDLLKLIFSLQFFANGARGHGECLKYLCSGHIPEELKDDWEPFHGCLKKLYKTVDDALEWISGDLSYFQTDTGVEDKDTNIEREKKYEVVQSAVQHMEKGYRTKMKDNTPRMRRLYTHFFLGSGNGLDKFIHKRKVDGLLKGTSLSEKRMKWLSGEVWKKPEIAKMLKRVSGWTDDGVVYLEGPQKQKLRYEHNCGSSAVC
ncbi:unnamed protein product [Pleuronectes platessa]|uniref:Sterile alpha motif domain-containing protein 9-like n=1 Tax=Pleuronectes platessa TaxID=8262 RepID=A0A9N7YVN6_PLEPL|nr:unnamed protein product [Pleuronectes platessa]